MTVGQFFLDVAKIIGILIVVPLLGGLLTGVDRKISARMQRRKGPPILQPFYDVMKLFQKEALTVNRLTRFYITFSLFFTAFTTVLLFMGADLMLIIFALTLTSIFFVIAGYSASSPFSLVGAERELLQIISYEPMVLITGVGFYYAQKTFQVADIMHSSTPSIVYLPLVFLGFVYIMTFKLRKSPFDLSFSEHGHQEIVKGLTTELTGVCLGMVEIMHWLETMFVLALVFLFFASSAWYTDVIGVVVCAIVYFLEILIDNSFARVKWQKAFTVSWIVTAIAGFVNLGVLSLFYLA